jgi:photosystem II stability/assembly factor-like uncharacterized protein
MTTLGAKIIRTLLWIGTLLVLVCHASSAQWTQMTRLYGGVISNLTVVDTDIVASTNYDGVFRIGIHQQQWTKIISGIPQGTFGQRPLPFSFLTTEHALLMGALSNGLQTGGIFRSTDHGSEWHTNTEGFTVDEYGLYPDVYSLCSLGSAIIAGTNHGIYFSTDDGLTWQKSKLDSVNQWVPALAILGSRVVGYTIWGDNIQSRDTGRSSTRFNLDIPWPPAVFAGTNNFWLTGTWQGGIYRSVDSGTTWQHVYGKCDIKSFFFMENHIYAVTDSAIVVSSDEGLSWEPIKTRLNVSALSFTVAGGKLYMGTYGLGVFVRDDTTWEPMNNGLILLGFSSFAKHGNSLYASTGYGAYVSTDEGETWLACNNGLQSSQVRRVMNANGTVWTCCGDAVYGLNDDGRSWRKLRSGISAMAMITAREYTYVSDSWGYQYSPDQGDAWYSPTSVLSNRHIAAWEAVGDTIFAGTADSGVFRTADFGRHWSPMNAGLGDLEIKCMGHVGTTIFLGTIDGKIYQTVDRGVHWERIGQDLVDSFTGSFVIAGNMIFAGDSSGNIALSTDEGASWKTVNVDAGGPNEMYPMYIADGILYVGTRYDGTWRRPISEITGIESPSSKRHNSYELSQNYPNPFNPTTNLSYNLTTTSHVRLTISNLLGQTVGTVVDGVEQAGVHTREWSAATFSSGVYYYRLEATSVANTGRTFTSVKKMLLIR